MENGSQEIRREREKENGQFNLKTQLLFSETSYFLGCKCTTTEEKEKVCKLLYNFLSVSWKTVILNKRTNEKVD